MEKNVDRMPKALNYMEHLVDFANFIPSPSNSNLVHIQFMVTKPEPVIRGKKDSEHSNQVSVEVSMETELQHSCTVILPKHQLLEMKKNLEDLLEKIDK
ncbi:MULTISPECIES: hypothetical protein [Enterobacteriaceae]|uniref:Uncharacterized protein n=2 Tax=Citrobacter koseri TaxID=545 RepID=A0A2X2YQK2_CITKO|nr:MULTISPECIES: hypothetical protein [Enterobacteriaceae]MBJ8865280.1 hypothetical protein [Citrobacter koseri]MBL4565028.1 hypothetical protein [Citrobacter koseri]MDM2947313.1 hypothetical protein [Citrobacter sp. CK207]MDM2980640.1 hypothetical protein [Citrobacter sp. CK197]WFW70896.1 hypothetical protein NFJ78_10245 [Citrobacter braakii]